MFIHFFCLCPLGLATKLNFNISKEAYWFRFYFTLVEKAVRVFLTNYGAQ